MTYRDWDKAQSQISYKRRYEASQQAMKQLRRENRIRGQCLEIAMEALQRVAGSKTTTWRHDAARTLFDIEARLAELEPGPEEETE